MTTPPVASASHTTVLDRGWVLELTDPSAGTEVPDRVRDALPVEADTPGTVHTDLLRHGLICDPYIDRNELTLDWVGRTSWSYTRVLEAPAEWFDDDTLTAGTRVQLEFDGLDTVATVLLNGIELAKTANMHRRWIIDVAPALRPGNNELVVRFDSVWDYAARVAQQVGERPNAYPTPFNLVRKNASNFGWDWGPTLVTAGIWREARVVRHQQVWISQVRPIVRVSGDTGTVDLSVDLDWITSEPSPVRLVGEIAGQTASLLVEPDDKSRTARATVQLTVKNPRLWWPVDLGDQPLYRASLTLESDAGPLDDWSSELAFRTVELLTEADDTGTGFAVAVNGVTVPVRGANWIPDDCFLPRVTPQRLRQRLDQAVGANLNLLRVWGGGVYESDAFYTECDARGIMVWQDFLFACAAYPEEEPLRSEVIAEAEDNVARLMAHPSLILWNGNNENIWGWHDWGWQPKLEDRTWGRGYYLRDLPAVVAEVDPTRPYWPGSPYSGSEGIHPNDPAHGCTHIWDVWNSASWRHYANYDARFVSEFGWQGPPTWATMTQSIRDEPLTPDSPGMLHHQKAEDGNGKLERGLRPHLDVPTSIDDWHWAMQLNQAHAIRFGIEHFRSRRPRNQGYIVWQLNDCWPVTSWAAVDGYGRAKPLWFALRAAGAPRLVTVHPRDAGAGYEVTCVNDLGSTWRESVTVTRHRFDGTELARMETRLVVDRFGATTLPIPADVAEAADKTAEILVVETASGLRATHLYAEPRDLALPPVDVLAATIREKDDVIVSVTARSLIVDLVIFPDRLHPDATASEALITLLPGERTEVVVSGLPSGLEGSLGRRPVLRALNDLVSLS
ncbi:glycoside hydrolase family 2 protein [Ruania rhizosphaerae]|uniref:glycoside hydrolase family 2 protein n=1 Tax=Ruania rhizosphaerae TaxID=1840413 RepID=UPI00135A01AC|nr:glycoside hydrolase family 2 TIM barrel-domain containing protein [Ruania rhizosphaerae]